MCFCGAEAMPQARFGSPRGLFATPARGFAPTFHSFFTTGG
jgi:hypothetical protein